MQGGSITCRDPLEMPDFFTCSSRYWLGLLYLLYFLATSLGPALPWGRGVCAGYDTLHVSWSFRPSQQILACSESSRAFKGGHSASNPHRSVLPATRSAPTRDTHACNPNFAGTVMRIDVSYPTPSSAIDPSAA